MAARSLLAGVLYDPCEVVVSQVEAVVGQLERAPAGLLTAEVADLPGHVIGERPGAAAPGEPARHPQQVVPGIERTRRRVGTARPGVVVAGQPAAIVGLLDSRQVGLEAGDRVGLRRPTGSVEAERRGDVVRGRERAASVEPVRMVGGAVEVGVRAEAAGDDRAGEARWVIIGDRVRRGVRWLEVAT